MNVGEHHFQAGTGDLHATREIYLCESKTYVMPFKIVSDMCQIDYSCLSLAIHIFPKASSPNHVLQMPSYRAVIFDVRSFHHGMPHLKQIISSSQVKGCLCRGTITLVHAGLRVICCLTRHYISKTKERCMPIINLKYCTFLLSLRAFQQISWAWQYVNTVNLTTYT